MMGPLKTEGQKKRNEAGGTSTSICSRSPPGSSSNTLRGSIVLTVRIPSPFPAKRDRFVYRLLHFWYFSFPRTSTKSSEKINNAASQIFCSPQLPSRRSHLTLTLMLDLMMGKDVAGKSQKLKDRRGIKPLRDAKVRNTLPEAQLICAIFLVTVS